MTPETGLTADIAVSLQASIDGLAAAVEKDYQSRQRQAEVVRQVPFAGSISITGGIGVYDQPDQLQAKSGYYWDIRRLTVNGFSAGTVIVYRNGNLVAATGLNPGEVLVPYAVPATNTFTKASMLLAPNDRINFGATGITAATGQISF